MFKAYFNTSQPRVKKKSICIGVSDTLFDASHSVDVFFHQETGTFMLKPDFLAGRYNTNFSGENARFTLSDFGITAGTVWAQRTIGNASNIVLEQLTVDSTTTRFHQEAYTTPTGIVFSFMNYTSQNDVVLNATFGFGNKDTGQKRIWVEAYSNGTYIMYKNIGSGTEKILEGSLHNEYYDQATKNKSTSGQTVHNSWIRIGLIPYFMTYGILLISSSGGEIYFYDDDLEELGENYWEGQSFFFNTKPNNSIIASKMKFIDTGLIFSEKYYFHSIPTSTPTIHVTSENGGTFTNSFVQTDGVTTWSGQSKGKLRSLVAKNSDGSTPFIYNYVIDFDGTYTTTDSTEQVEIVDKVLEASINFPEKSSSGETTIIVKGEETLSSNNIYLNSPMALKVNTIQLQSGKVEDLNYAYDVRYQLETTPIELTCSHFWGLLSDFQFKDSLVLDGYTLNNAIRRIFREVGVRDTDLVSPSNIFLQSNSVTIGPSRFGKDEFAFKIDVGQTALQGLESLLEHYASNWFYDFVPAENKVIFKAGDPSFWGFTVRGKFYTERTNITSDTRYNSNSPTRLIAKNVRIDLIPLAGNHVSVSGYSPLTGQYIQVIKQDSSSIDPELEPSLRPKNWVGGERNIGYESSKITDFAVATDICNLLYTKYTTLYRLVQFDGFLQIENRVIENGTTEKRLFYKYDVVEIENVGLATIISMSLTVKLHEQTTDQTFRNKIPVKYVCKQRWDNETSTWTYIKYN